MKRLILLVLLALGLAATAVQSQYTQPGGAVGPVGPAVTSMPNAKIPITAGKVPIGTGDDFIDANLGPGLAYDSVTNTLYWTGSGSTCSAASNEVGDRTTYTQNHFVPGYIAVLPVTADCTGTLNYAKIYQTADSSGSTTKLCVYPRTGAPSESNTLIGCTSITMTSDAGVWLPSDTSATISGTVANGNYWLAVISSGDIYIGANPGTGAYYQACAGCYASPPANLSGSWSSDTFGSVSAYATIGN